MTKPVTDYAASARARLLIATNKRKGDFQLTLQRYCAERFFWRSKLVDAPSDFGLVGERVCAFLEAPVRAVSNGEGFGSNWPLGGPWR
jgi:hypothetical protein